MMTKFLTINQFPIFHQLLAERRRKRTASRSLQFRVNDYLTLLVTLLISCVLHLNQILLICSSACVVGYLTTF